jgi:hypothetical protein
MTQILATLRFKSLCEAYLRPLNVINEDVEGKIIPDIVAVIIVAIFASATNMSASRARHS